MCNVKDKLHIKKKIHIQAIAMYSMSSLMA